MGLSRSFEFGPFRLDRDQLLLYRGADVVPLATKPLQLLAALAEADGAVVSKEELGRVLWPDVVTSPGNLHQCVATLRKALGPRPDGAEWVENVPKAGYRLTSLPPTPEVPAPAPPKRRRVAPYVAGGLALVALAILLSRRGGAPAGPCATGEPTAEPGYRVSSWATGFPHWITGGCQGVVGMAVAPSGDVYAVGEADGNLYRFGAGGGAVDGKTRVTKTPYPISWCVNGLAFSRDGRRLYMARQFCGLGGDVVEVSTTDGHVVREVATGIQCATALATDPASGDLFVSTPCPGGTDHVYRIAEPASEHPVTSIYSTPGGALGLAFASDGTLWTEAFRFDLSTRYVVRIAGTRAPDAGTYTYVSSDPLVQDSNSVVPSDDPSILYVLREGGIARMDLSTTPPKLTPLTSRIPSAVLMIGAKDGCLLADASDRILRLSAADGSCRLPVSADRFASAVRP
jgi:DNA-binding winged helix-turn-helix (wHTH) protein